MQVYSWEKHGPKRENSYDSPMVMICTVMMLSMAQKNGSVRPYPSISPEKLGR